MTLNELKAHLRISHSDDDALIQGWINDAVNQAEKYTDTIIKQRSITKKFEKFGTLYLPTPLISVDVITYLDTDGVTQTLYSTSSSPQVSSSVFQVVGVWSGGDPTPRPYLTEAYGQSWPDERQVPESVQVTVTAGYTDAQIPDDIRAAVYLFVGHRYENRESTMPGVSIMTIPFGFRESLNCRRVWSL